MPEMGQRKHFFETCNHLQCTIQLEQYRTGLTQYKFEQNQRQFARQFTNSTILSSETNLVFGVEQGVFRFGQLVATIPSVWLLSNIKTR